MTYPNHTAGRTPKILNAHTSTTSDAPTILGKSSVMIARSTDQVWPGNHWDWTRKPTVTPKIASTLDHANQYPNVAIGPRREKYRRQPSWAYSAIPPDFSGNIKAVSA